MKITSLLQVVRCLNLTKPKLVQKQTCLEKVFLNLFSTVQLKGLFFHILYTYVLVNRARFRDTGFRFDTFEFFLYVYGTVCLYTKQNKRCTIFTGVARVINVYLAKKECITYEMSHRMSILLSIICKLS